MIKKDSYKTNSLRLYIIIPVFNRKDITLNCLKLLHNQTYQNFETIVVDDGSTDGTEEAIRESYPKTVVIRGNGNWWWTKSVNEGCKYALASHAFGILLMNDDIEFKKNYLQELINCIAHYPNSIIGSLSLTVEKPHKIFFSGIKKRNVFTAKISKYHKQFSLYEPDKITGIHSTEVLPGRGVYIPAIVFDKIGFLNEDKMPQYYSDFDFTNRAKRIGFNVLINWDLIVYSYWKETGKGAIYSNLKFMDFLKAFTNKYTHRSLMPVYNYFKAFSPWYILPITLINHHLRVFFSYFRYKILNLFK